MARGVRPDLENIGQHWNPRPTEADRLPPSVPAAGCRTAFRQPTVPHCTAFFRFFFAVSEFSQGNGGDFEVAEVSSCKRLVKASMFKLNCHIVSDFSSCDDLCGTHLSILRLAR